MSIGDIPRLLAKRNVLWQYPYLYQDTYGACDVIRLNPGLIISNDSPETMMISMINSASEYQARCTRGMLVPSALNSMLQDAGIMKLPALELGWNEYIEKEYHFIYTVYPIIYSLSCCTFICCFLTMIIFTKQYMRSQKPTVLIKVSSLLAFLYVLSIYIFSIINLYNQYKHLYSSGDLLIEKLQDSIPFNVVDLVIVILLQLSQVQIIMRLFPRRREKRFTFVTGLILSISSQAIWSVSTFIPSRDRLGSDPDYDSSIAILPAFVYLLRIAMSVLFSCLLVVYFFNKRQYIFNPKVIPLTLLTFIIMNSSFAIFIADIANIWVSELSELFNVTAYVVINVVSWEFINRIVLLEKAEQKTGILGRQFYDEEDQYYFDSFGNAVERKRIVKKGKYDLIITSHDKESPSSTNLDKDLQTEIISKPSRPLSSQITEAAPRSHLMGKWNDITERLATFTDHLVEMSPSVPKPHGSSRSDESLYDMDVSRERANILPSFNFKKRENLKRNASQPAPSHNQKVFVYKQREIKFEPGRKNRPNKAARRKNPANELKIENNNDNNDDMLQNARGNISNSNNNHDQETFDNTPDEEIIHDDGTYDFDEHTSNENTPGTN